MEKQKMTIHRALSELKLIDAKIEKQIAEIQPTGVMQRGKLVNGHIKEEDFNTTAKSKFDSIQALIERKSVIKSAIVQSNGVTKVKIATKEMTVADAINFKMSVAAKKLFIDTLKARHAQSVAKLNNHNEKVEINVQNLLVASFGKDNVKVSKEDVEAIRKPFMDNNECVLVDPLDVTKKIEAMEKEVGDFQAEVDAVLSETNAITSIEI